MTGRTLDVRVSGIEQPVEGTWCPDCERVIPGDREAFVQHRETEHPPAVRAISGVGAITSQEAVGTPGGGR